MTTKEFIEKVAKLGCKAVEHDQVFSIYYADRYTAMVDKYVTGKMDTHFEYFKNIPSAKRHELVDLMLEFSKTPIAWREEIK